MANGPWAVQEYFTRQFYWTAPVQQGEPSIEARLHVTAAYTSIWNPLTQDAVFSLV